MTFFTKILIVGYITNFGKANRQEITTLLDNILEILSKQQKVDKITNFLFSHKKNSIIKIIDR